ncbi:MAG: hypothetical protein J1G38_05000 [Clostridiales bacterium]|nr:hypothetical protein [Clostridiales bacterium]
MLIAFTVTAGLLAVLYLLINIFHKTYKKPDCEFSTEPTRFLLVISHLMFAIGFLTVALEIYLLFVWDDKAALWTIYGILLAVAIIGLIGLYEQYFTYAAIKDDSVYIRKFFKFKIIKVGDIRRIVNDGRHSIGFFGKHNKCLFHVDSFTPGVNELIGRINVRKSDIFGDESEEDEAFSEEKAILTRIGHEYRESYKQRRKSQIIGFSTVGAAILAAVVLLMLLLRANVLATVLISVMLVFAIALNLLVTLAGLKKELNWDDFALGEKYKFTDKRVKGASKNKFIATLVLCITLMLLGAVFMLGLIGISAERKNFDELTPITGQLEYCREQYGKYAYVAIGFYNIPTEYRLSSTYLDEFDYSFLKEVKVGDTITIYIDSSADSEFSLSGVKKKKWNNFYYLATEEKEYFSYEDYIKSEEYYEYVCYVIVGLGAALLAGSTAAIIITFIVYKKRAKREDVEI